MIGILQRYIAQTSPIRLLWHKAKALVAALRYGFPARGLCIIGITGTDGKTTTVAMTAHILHAAGIRTAALSTAYFQIGEMQRWNPTQKTSPSPFIIQRFLRDVRREGCTHVVLEYSSHGLVQGRMQWTWPLVGTVTNLSEEHLDYHGTMEAYRDAKGILLTMLRRNGGTKVLHADDATYSHYSTIPTAHTIVCGSHGEAPAKAHEGAQSLWLQSPTATPQEIRATIQAGQQHIPLHLPMAGSFNLTNAILAIGCAHAVGVPVADAAEALTNFHGVPGRMERIDEGQPFSVFIDFTVTPQSYQATLTTLRQSLSAGKRLLVLTGSCGDRMREKRPIVGRLCGTLADVVVVTNEDPYTEDPEAIIDAVLGGIPPEMPVYTATKDLPMHAERFALRISNRRDAIRWILRAARPGDIVLLAGKGSDVTMWTKKGQIPWNERDITRDELRSLSESPLP